MLIETIAIQLRLTFRFQFGPFFKPFAQVQIQYTKYDRISYLLMAVLLLAVTIAITIGAGVPHELFTILNRLYCVINWIQSMFSRDCIAVYRLPHNSRWNKQFE